MKLTELHIDGYRSLVNVTLPLRNLMAVIGPNGSGKTALLEVFLLLKYAAEKQLTDRLESLGGLQAVISRTANAPEKIAVHLLADLESPESESPMTYHFELAPRGTGHDILYEVLEWKGYPSHPNVSPLLEVKRGAINHPRTVRETIPPYTSGQPELRLAKTPLGAETEILRNLLADIQYYAFLDVGQRAIVRLPQSLTPTRRPGPNGENLYSTLYNLRSNDLDSYNRIVEVLQTGFPGFQRLEFPVVGAGQVTMAWYQKGIATPFYPNQLSEGTLRFLWLTAILLSPDAPSLILLDEPEVSLHPELLMLLAGLLQDASARSQIAAATHSSELIRWLEPNEVLIADKDEAGATTFTWADTLNLEKWLKEYTLGDLWLMGNLGGRS